MDERNVNRKLNILCYCLIAVVAIVVCLGETAVLPVGILADEDALPTDVQQFRDLMPAGRMSYSFVLQIVECLVMLAMVPLALKYMDFYVIKRLVTLRPGQYFMQAAVRMLMLAIPIVLGILLYYMMLNTSMLYCSLISALAFLYIWPTTKRLRRETNKKEEERQ